VNPVIILGLDVYCPNCHKEMYLPLVASLIRKGGTCPWCNQEIRSGECIEWTTFDKNTILSSEMTTQHISNILHMYDCHKSHTSVYDILLNELKYRNEERLPYVPYYDNETESKILGGNND
jgi:hypothetical protein